MVDLVFSKSAAGTLNYAQGLGRGPYRPGCVSFIMEEGKKPSRWRLWWMRRQYHKKEKKKWKSAVVLEGRREDVFCLALSLSIGKLDGESREEVLWNMSRYDVLPEQVEAAKRAVQKHLGQMEENLTAICARLKAGEPLRIWLGVCAEDQCMAAWFAQQMLNRKVRPAKIFLNQLPSRYQLSKGTAVSFESWAEVEPMLWGKLDQKLRKEAPEVYLDQEAQLWQRLCQENGELRILEDGRLKSVAADYYDSRIQAEIDRQPEEFPEAHVIGNLIGDGLRMPDTWIANRIERYIEAGQLTAIAKKNPSVPSYRKKIKKNTTS